MSRLLLTIVLACIAAPAASAEELTAEQRNAITMAFLDGNLEILAEEPEDLSPEAMYPYVLYRRWWRGVHDRSDARSHSLSLAVRRELQATGPREDASVTRRRLSWMLNSELQERGAPYPMPKAGETDPWPVISALVQDRLLREKGGLQAVREADPIAALVRKMRQQGQAGTLSVGAQHQLDWLEQARNDFSYSYDGDPPTEAARESKAEGEAIASRNGILALIAVLLLVAVPVFIGRRLGGRRVAKD